MSFKDIALEFSGNIIHTLLNVRAKFHSSIMTHDAVRDVRNWRHHLADATITTSGVTHGVMRHDRDVKIRKIVRHYMNYLV